VSSPRFEPLLTAAEVRRAEEAHDGPLEELMERAGTAVARVVLARFPGRVAVVCGRGNNGGDGRVAARVLREAGREVTEVGELEALPESDVVVDALLGIGLDDAPRDEAARLIEQMNASGRPVVSVDVPSGVDASTGRVPGVAVRATATVTFGAAKVGLAVAPGRFHAGAVHVAPIGLAVGEHEHALVPATVLPESTLPALEAHVLEAVKRPLPEDSAGRLLPRAAEPVLDAAERADAVAIGPGLGRGDGTRELVRILLERLEQPVVLDADALWGLEPFTRRAPTILTPHTGELARLLGATADEVDGYRLDAARRAASQFGCVVLLKGADTLVAEGRQGVLVAGYGQPSLATAGTGDVLTGVVAAFLAKGLEPRLAAAAGAVAHGLASRLVAAPVGLVASDLLPGLQRALAGEGWHRSPLED
jgi:NAD(P)H-hydrate epimerase